MSHLKSLTRRFAAAFAPLLALALSPAAMAAAPRYDHVVIVVMENHSSSQVIGNANAPYITSLSKAGANLTNSHGVTHPSQPNYLALFSGSTQGVTNDACPFTFSKANLGSQLIAAGLSFVGYSEGLPSAGSTACTAYPYARKHVPWVNFSNVPAASNQPLSSFPSDYSKLPTVSFVIPNLLNDMHDGTVSGGDSWLKQNIDGYAQWAKTHNSLLIVTFDEDDNTASNLIPTVFYGAGVNAGNYADNVNHYNVLATVQSFYGLAALNAAPAITSIFGGGGGNVLLSNGDFESGSSGWTASTGVLGNASGQSAHGGNSYAWLCGYGSAHSDSLKQTLTLPAGSRPLLSYWLHIDTAETGSTATDSLKIQVVNASGATSTLATFSNANAASGYRQQFLDLSAFAGQTITLQFSASENGSKQTSFVLDDLALTLQ